MRTGDREQRLTRISDQAYELIAKGTRQRLAWAGPVAIRGWAARAFSAGNSGITARIFEHYKKG